MCLAYQFIKVIIKSGRGKEWNWAFLTALGNPCAPKVCASQGAFHSVTLTSHLIKTTERIILRQIRRQVSITLDPLQFPYCPGIRVDDAKEHWTHWGWGLWGLFFFYTSPVLLIQYSQHFWGRKWKGWELTNTWLHGPLSHNRSQYVRLKDYVSDVVLWSMGAPQGTVVSCSLFTLYTSVLKHNIVKCHLKKFSIYTAVVGCVSQGNEQEYREVINDFVNWRECNHLHINTSKTKVILINFQR